MSRQFADIAHQIMSDKTAIPLLIAPRVAWPLAVMIRLAARHPGRPAWGKKSSIALAKRFEKAVKARHPMPDLYRMEDLEPIMRDDQEMSIEVTMAEAFEIVGDVQLCTRHPDIRLGNEALRISVDAAKQIQVRIVEYHPDAWLMMQMSWDEKYDI